MRVFSIVATIIFSLIILQTKAQITSLNFYKIVNTAAVTYLDLDYDGDPNIPRSFVNDSIRVQWIDDDDNVRIGDLQGDMDNDCLMSERNQDGKYGDELDLIVDWIDENDYGKQTCKSLQTMQIEPAVDGHRDIL